MLLNEIPVIAPAANPPEASLRIRVEAPFAVAPFVAMAIESAAESPVIVIPVPAVKVSVSVEESATGLVPDGVEMVANELEAEPLDTVFHVGVAPAPADVRTCPVVPT
jgi:hypothetical protein